MLQRAPQPLHDDVIHPAAAAIHRDFDLVSLEDISEGGAGELTALVGVENLRLAEPRQRLLSSSSSERGFCKWSFRSSVSAFIFGSGSATTIRHEFRGAERNIVT